MARIPSLYILLLFIFLNGCATAEPTVSEDNKVEFELQHGDRVVLLGNSLIQNDLEYGYIEYALTTLWPERDITFRNLGWTGDNVYGEARSYYTTPPDSYDLLIKQLKEANPTVVFIGYGANEAYKGKKGVSDFKKGLRRLLDEIEEMGARAVLLSPIPQISGLPSEKLLARNENIRLYASVISEIASEDEVRYIDLFSPVQDYEHKNILTADGIQLNENGYYYLASILEDELGLSQRNWTVGIDFSEQIIDVQGRAEILVSQFNDESMRFTVDGSVLPLPPPTSDAAIKNNTGQRFKVKGLRDGYYTLKMETIDVRSASAKRWSDGIDIKQGILYKQASELKEIIVQKNQLFFRKYRPTNRTYLVGFRSFEQGQNSKELEQLDLFINRLENKIFQLRKPRPNDYNLTTVE